MEKILICFHSSSNRIPSRDASLDAESHKWNTQSKLPVDGIPRIKYAKVRLGGWTPVTCLECQNNIISGKIYTLTTLDSFSFEQSIS